MNNFLVPLLASTAFGWSYFRLLRGTGIPVGGLIGAVTAAFVMFNPLPGRVLTGLLVLAAIVVEINFQRRRRQFAGSEMVFEGGGIRRGLSPAKAGTLFDLADRNLLLVGLVHLLQKGLLAYSMEGTDIHFEPEAVLRVDDEILNPVEKKRARKLSAQREGMLLTADEDVLVELIDQHEGQSVCSVPAQVWIDRLKAQTLEDLDGYKVEKTLKYYDDYITHRLNGVAVGHFSAEDYIDWMALAYVMGVLDTEPLVALVKETRPAWLQPDEDYISWLDRLKEAVKFAD